MLKISFLLFFLSLIVCAQDDTTVTLNANNISITFLNNGMLYGQNGGASWNNPAGNSSIVFDHSLCLAGKINNQPVAAFSQWSPVFSPGFIYKAAPVTPDPGQDAPTPEFLKERAKRLDGQIVWSMFSFDTAYANNSKVSGWWNENFQPFPVEIHQVAYAHNGNLGDDQNILNNVVFIEWTIINKGTQPIDSFYAALWTDIDLEPWNKNYFGVDTTLQTGFIWPGENVSYPAVGYTLLYGPAIESSGSSALFKGYVKDGYRNLPLSSYHPVGDDGWAGVYSPASSTAQAWNLSRGVKTDGTPWIDTVTNAIARFPFADSPSEGSHWKNPEITGGGAGFFMFTGPVTLAPSDTQWVMIALVPGYGSSNIESVNEVKRKAEYLRTLPYEQIAFSKPSSVDNQEAFVSEFNLAQNYPNPFNPYTNFNYTVPSGITNTPVTLKIFDILGNEVAVLVNEEKSGGKYNVRFNGNGLSSGVYFAELKAGSFVSTKKITLLK